ncbi:MAG: aminoacyl--tRNA ligase-related protein [Akkermansia muciniphila]
METVTDSTMYNPANGSLLTEAREFNLMFKTTIGATSDENDPNATGWLRPETAQSIFCQYKNILDSSRVKLPFGIAQIGKSFRNEINPRNFTFRSREFEQMEIEYFCRPEDGLRLVDEWLEHRLCFYDEVGFRANTFTFWMCRTANARSTPRKPMTWSMNSPSASRNWKASPTGRIMT